MNELLDSIRAEFRRLGTAENRAAAQRFHQPDEHVDGYGVRAPEVQRMARELYGQVKKWPAADRDRLCVALWESRLHEEGALVIYLYRRFAKQFGAREFRMFTGWLDRYVADWSLTDGLSQWLLGGCISNDASLIGELDAWTRSKNRWKRRAAAVALEPSASRGLHTEAVFRIATPLMTDADVMVQKGVGWLLKETYPKKPRETMRFLLPWRASAPRLLLRYAAEKMSAADKARVMTREN
jgi:3-methyladenine DNA glycosylase AlkD